MTPDAHITHLYIYPIKSCAGIAIDRAVVGPRGLEVAGIGDRRWMLADSDGMMVTQRERPHLARIGIALQDGGLRAMADGMDPLTLDPAEAGEERTRIVLHGKEVIGHRSPAAVDDWFSRYLDEPVRLIYQKDDDFRPCDENFAIEPGIDRVGFADAYPYLLTNSATLARLNEALASPAPMDRFRPNIVIDGATPDAEYGWKRIAVGPVEFALVKPCTRCIVVTTDQRSGVRCGKEPLAALGRTYFLSANIGVAKVQGAIFGENAIPTRLGEIRLGDAVTALENKPRYIFRQETIGLQ